MFIICNITMFYFFYDLFNKKNKSFKTHHWPIKMYTGLSLVICIV